MGEAAIRERDGGVIDCAFEGGLDCTMKWQIRFRHDVIYMNTI